MKDESRQQIEVMAQALRVALALARPDVDLTYKPMFGGAGFWVDGKIFAAWLGGTTLSLKLPPERRQALLAAGGSVQSYFKEYVNVPPHYQNEPHLMADDVAASVDYVLRLKKLRKQ
ncbi:MAG: TfoX/Sxy family protein [Anaerolineae bacterium]|nr:TfoX/Sxy family protein [Anaerolineae bacterium]MDW8174022.1 TfoX/Sxy family protein [Anaerolineae bacterium]